MFRVFYILLFLSIISASNAQSELDSLRKVSKRLMMTDRDAYFEVSKKIIKLLKEEKSDSLLALYYLSNSMMRQMGKEYQRALEYNDSVLLLKDIPMHLSLRASLGKAEMMWKLNYPIDDVFNILDKNLEIAIKLNDSISISSLYFRYSNIYLDKGKYFDAINALKKASEIRPNNLLYPKVMDLSKLSKLFLLINNLDKAEFYYSKAMSIALSQNYKIANTKLAILGGLIEKAKGNYDKSDSLYNLAQNNFIKYKADSDVFNTYVLLLELGLKRYNMEKINKYLDLASQNIKYSKDKGIQAKYYLVKAKINLKRKKYEQAGKDLIFAKKIIRLIHNLPYEIEYYKILSSLEKQKKNYEKSLILNDIYHSLSDSLYKFKSKQLILDIEEKYNAEEKQKQIELLEANNALFENRIKQAKLEKYLLLGGVGTVLLFLLFLGITYLKVKEKNSIIEKALQQKDFLLKEIHHRVKNNLQLITSLLNLQSKYIKDEKAKEVSLDGKNRVRAMSLIHQFLYKKNDLVNMELGEYFEKLVNELFEAYQVSEDRIKVNYDIDKVEIDIDRVIPLGLIFNELITNILKYAFPDGKTGEIDIRLKRVRNDIVFEINDNGVGFKSETDVDDENSFGFTLIEALLQKWNGKFEIDSFNGTHAKIIIPFAGKTVL